MSRVSTFDCRVEESMSMIETPLNISCELPRPETVYTQSQL